MTETGDAWEEEEADIEAELAMWEAPSCWLPPREGRHYVYKPVSSQVRPQHCCLPQPHPASHT